jgi:predicted metalloprotease with PDZ domain
MKIRRTITAVALVSMLGVQMTPVIAHAENPMGYRLVTTQLASRLPNNQGSLGLDIAPARQISDPGMTFALMRVQRVRAGSPAAQAGFQRGDQIIAVNGRVFPTGTAFASYVQSMAPGSRVSIDYIPAGGGPRNAERVAVVVGKPGAGGTHYAQAQEQPQGMSTRTKIGLGAAALLGCYYFGCFSGSSSR